MTAADSSAVDIGGPLNDPWRFASEVEVGRGSKITELIVGNAYTVTKVHPMHA